MSESQENQESDQQRNLADLYQILTVRPVIIIYILTMRLKWLTGFLYLHCSNKLALLFP